MQPAPPASFDSLREAIHARFDRLSPHLQRIARFALDDPNGFALRTVAEIAEATAVQPSSVIRFAQAFAFRGFSDMQRVFRVRLIEGAPDRRERILARPIGGADLRPGDPLAILHEFADASAQSLQQLKTEVSAEAMTSAIKLIEAARDIHVIGLRRAFPVAAYMFYGLVRSERRCHLLDAVGGMVPQQVATMSSEDLLIAVAFAEYAALTVEVVKDVHIRGIPTLTITDTPWSPLARNASLAFTIRDPDIHPFRSLAAAMCLVQTLIVALGRDQQKPAEASGSGAG